MIVEQTEEWIKSDDHLILAFWSSFLHTLRKSVAIKYQHNGSTTQCNSSVYLLLNSESLMYPFHFDQDHTQ